MIVTNLIGGMALALTAASAAGLNTAQAGAQRSEFKVEADALVRLAYAADGPGAAVVVTQRGRVIYAAGQGLADLDARRAITPDTVFRLGSITKQFTAAAVLQLVAEGKLSLNDPLSRFFPDWPQPGARATVRQLLNHSSGLQDFSKIPGFMLSAPTLRPNSTADLLAVTRGRPAVSEPGTRWEYNNGGYVVLGAIIEKVTGRPWHEAVTTRIARPLGLRTLAYAGAVEGAAANARGYSLTNGRPQPARGVHISVAHAAGGLVASASDLAKWAGALHGGKVVTPALYAEMIRPAQLADGSTQPYGFGLRLQRLRGRAALAHGGAGRGLDADSIFVPAQGLFVAVLANSDQAMTDPSLLTRRLAALATGQPIPSFVRADVPMAEIEPFLGAYRADRGPPLTFFARGGKLYLGHGDQEMEAVPAGGGRFFFGPSRLAWIQLARGANGSAVMELHEPELAGAEQAVRTGPVPPPLTVPPETLRSYAGRYQTETVAATIALGADGRLTIAAADQPALPMRPTSQTEFSVDAGRYRVVFHPEGGRVDRLTLHRGARQLNGRRTAE